MALLPPVTQVTHSHSSGSPSSSIPSSSSPFETTFISTPTSTLSNYSTDPGQPFSSYYVNSTGTTPSTNITTSTSPINQSSTLCDDYGITTIVPLTAVPSITLSSSTTSSSSSPDGGKTDKDATNTNIRSSSSSSSSTVTTIPTNTLTVVVDNHNSTGTVKVTGNFYDNILSNHVYPVNCNNEITSGNLTHLADDANIVNCGSSSVSSAVATASSIIENGFSPYCHNHETINFYPTDNISIENLNEQEQASAFFDHPTSSGKISND